MAKKPQISPKNAHFLNIVLIWYYLTICGPEGNFRSIKDVLAQRLQDAGFQKSMKTKHPDAHLVHLCLCHLVPSPPLFPLAAPNSIRYPAGQKTSALFRRQRGLKHEK